MRIGTWNLEGKWSDGHWDVLLAHDCDVWLLAEVAAETRLSGYAATVTVEDMTPGKAWAAVLSRSALLALPDPHPASAAARVGDWTVCASVLPWRSGGGDHPWQGTDQTERTAAAVDAIFSNLPLGPLVWGGDFNHALSGAEVAGSAGGAAHIRTMLEDRRLSAPTIGLPHRLPGVLRIDHIAVPAQWQRSAERHGVAPGLSDHDVYVVAVSAT